MIPYKFIVLTTIILTVLNLNARGQKRLDKFRKNSNFEWVIDSLQKDLILYYEKHSYAEKNIQILKVGVKRHLTNTLDFIKVEAYDKSIHYFILEDRERINLLVGSETNGSANPQNNYVTAIFSENTKSVYSNHELFHLIAMNLWGYSESWINEGMAVYSDNMWQGHGLHELSKYLIDNDKYVSVVRLAKKLRKYDSRITYPLLGSFVKFIDVTYGRETTKLIWSKGRKKMKRHTGKSLEDFEKEWLLMLSAVTYKEIQYLN